MTSFLRKNIGALRRALDEHDERCPVAAEAFLLNPQDRAQLEETVLWGLEVRADGRVAEGRVRILCPGSAWRMEDELELHVLRIGARGEQHQVVQSGLTGASWRGTIPISQQPRGATPTHI
jgi:hypothetical protein